MDSSNFAKTSQNPFEALRSYNKKRFEDGRFPSEAYTLCEKNSSNGVTMTRESVLARVDSLVRFR